MTTTETRGLHANVYYNTRYRPCAGGGISETAETVTVVGVRDGADVTPLPRESRVFAPTDDAPAVVLVRRGRTVHAEPAERVGSDRVGYMAGGSFIASSDARFHELVGFYGAVSLHDRSETPATYAALSSD